MIARCITVLLLTLLIVVLDVGNAFSPEFREVSQVIGASNPYNHVFTAQWQVYVVQILFLGFLWYLLIRDWRRERKPSA